MNDTVRRYGREAACERATCAELDPHIGGAHLDPRSDLYDGPETLIGALPISCRDAAFALLFASRGDGWRRQVVDVALDSMGTTIQRLREQVAHVQVDRDRQVRAAMDRATDCEDHGKVITRLEGQVAHFETAARRNNEGRLALLGGLHPIGEAVRTLQERRRHGDALPEFGKFLDELDKALARMNAAHKRAWSKADNPGRPDARSEQSSITDLMDAEEALP